jgi:hypothetical protein
MALEEALSRNSHILLHFLPGVDLVPFQGADPQVLSSTNRFVC